MDEYKSLIFWPGLSYWQHLLRVGSYRQPFFGVITNIAAIIFIPLSILSHNWLLFLFCILYLFLSFYSYYQNCKQFIELTAFHMIYTSYNLFGIPSKIVIPLNEMLNVVLVKINRWFSLIPKKIRKASMLFKAAIPLLPTENL